MNEPLKTVYVRNYTDGLDDVKSIPSGDWLPYPYVPYSIYKLSMELETFTERNLYMVHPKAVMLDLQMSGTIFFEIHGMEFKVFYGGVTKDPGLHIKTPFEEQVFSEGKKVNNLNLFKGFKESFEKYQHLKELVGYNSETPNGIEWYIDTYHYKREKWKNGTDRLLVKVKPNIQFSDLYLAYDVYSTTDYSFKGISYGDVTAGYTMSNVIDLDYEIKHLTEKRQFVIDVTDELTTFFGKAGSY